MLVEKNLCIFFINNVVLKYFFRYNYKPSLFKIVLYNEEKVICRRNYDFKG